MVADLNKEFKVGFKEFSICRADYENMPDPMKTDGFDDEKMTELAKSIGVELKKWNFDEESEYYEDDVEGAFWREMEECAVAMGMTYYEDEDEEVCEEAYEEQCLSDLCCRDKVESDDFLYDWIKGKESNNEIETLNEDLANRGRRIEYDSTNDCYVVSEVANVK